MEIFRSVFLKIAISKLTLIWWLKLIIIVNERCIIRIISIFLTSLTSIQFNIIIDLQTNIWELLKKNSITGLDTPRDCISLNLIILRADFMIERLSTRSEGRFNLFTDCNVIRISCKFAKYTDERANCSRVVCAMIASISVSWCTSCSQEVGQIDGFQVVPVTFPGNSIPLSWRVRAYHHRCIIKVHTGCISLEWQAIIHSQVFRRVLEEKIIRKKRKKRKRRSLEEEKLILEKNSPLYLSRFWLWRYSIVDTKIGHKNWYKFVATRGKTRARAGSTA